MNTIKLLVMDVDGTLTDGKIYMSSTGEFIKAFNAKDGYGIANLLKNNGILPVIITGRSSAILEKRCDELKIVHLYQGVHNKLQKLQILLEESALDFDSIAYIGDDLNDLECIQAAKISACPSDAVAEIVKNVTYVCKSKGGEGAVREFIDYLLAMN